MIDSNYFDQLDVKLRNDFDETLLSIKGEYERIVAHARQNEHHLTEEDRYMLDSSILILRLQLQDLYVKYNLPL